MPSRLNGMVGELHLDAGQAMAARLSAIPSANNQHIYLDDRAVTPHDLSLRVLWEIQFNPRSAVLQKKFCFFGNLVPELQERFVGVFPGARQIDAVAGFHSAGQFSFESDDSVG